MNPKGITYKDSGVDLKKIRNTQSSIEKMILLTQPFLKTAKVISGFGHYAGLIDIGNKNVLAIHSDGVGTKVLIAQQLKRFNTVGIDCIAMNVNDIICTGSVPMGFVDYIAIKHPNKPLVNEIIKGLVRGAKESNIAIVGGETAVVPELLHGDRYSFDLAGTVAGMAKKNNLILGNKIRPGDIILGANSSGLHSNGYTLARKVLLSKYSLHDTADNIEKSIGDELLIPTRIYIKPVLKILKSNISVHGFAHITGGAFTKLTRLNSSVRFKLESLPAPYGIFKQIQEDGSIRLEEMYKTFNMGIGFCVIVSKEFENRICDIFESYNIPCKRVGTIEKGKGEVAVRVKEKSFLLSV